jgi:hypothetical protein
VGNRRNERKGHKATRKAAEERLADAERRLGELSAIPHRDHRVAKEIEHVKDQIKHWRAKAREKSETHSRRHKGNR